MTFFFFAAAVEQKQTVLVLGGLVAHSWTARGAEFLAMVNYRSLWETPKYEPPTLLLKEEKKRKKVALTNSGDVKWNSLFGGQRGRFHHLHRLSRQPQCETTNSREQADIRGRKTTRMRKLIQHCQSRRENYTYSLKTVARAPFLLLEASPENKN